MRLGIFVQSNLETGGEFYNSLNFINEIQKVKKKNIHIFTDNTKTFYDLKKYKINCFIVKFSFFDNLIFKLSNKINNFNIYPFISNFEKKLLKYDIDLIIFTSIYRKLSILKKVNFAITILDICHLYYKDFPEISKKEYQIREKILNKNISRCKAIFVESDDVKAKVADRYNCKKKKIYVRKFEAAPFKKKNNLIKLNKYEKFLFYPSSFWKHKNHEVVIKALKRLKEKGSVINVIFSGKDKGYKINLIKLTKNLKLDSQVIFLDRQNDYNILSLYNSCDAVLYPSFFGPANLPVAESWKYKKPLIYPKKFKSYVNDAAITFDNRSIKSCATAILKLKKKFFVKKIISKGKIELKKIKKNNLIEMKRFIKNLA